MIGVDAGDVAVSHDVGGGVAPAEGAQQREQRRLLGGSAVIDAAATAVDASDIGDVYDVGVVAFDAVARGGLGQELNDVTVGTDQPMPPPVFGRVWYSAT